MIATQNKAQQIAPIPLKTESKPTPLFIPQRLITHDPKAGLNPLVDACSNIFSTAAKLKRIKSMRKLAQIQNELIQEINSFQAVIKGFGYNPEYIAVCRYVLCAFLDDIITNTSWGDEGKWDNFALLPTFNQDLYHHDKFFSLIERSIKEPALYIDLMELIYLCLSLGYKGEFRSTEYNQYQLEQITDHLYKHIRAYRGTYSKTLSTNLLTTTANMNTSTTKNKTEPYGSLIFILLVTACVIMSIFISLGYLTDIIANDTFTKVKQIQVATFNENTKY